MDDESRRESDPEGQGPTDGGERSDPHAERADSSAGRGAGFEAGGGADTGTRRDPEPTGDVTTGSEPRTNSDSYPVREAFVDAWAEHRLYTYFAGALFALGILIGAGIAATGVNLLEEIAELTGEEVYAGVEFRAVGIFLNNAQVFVFSIVLGTITVGLFAVLVMVFNGVLVGNLVAIIGADVGYGTVAALIVPHGIFELPALFAACAVAFRLIHRLGQRILGRREAFVDRAYLYRTGIFVVVMFVVLAFAAVVEVHVTGWIAETLFGVELDVAE